MSDPLNASAAVPSELPVFGPRALPYLLVAASQLEHCRLSPLSSYR